jgi:hypothetical protein
MRNFEWIKLQGATPRRHLHPGIPQSSHSNRAIRLKIDLSQPIAAALCSAAQQVSVGVSEIANGSGIWSITAKLSNIQGALSNTGRPSDGTTTKEAIDKGIWQNASETCAPTQDRPEKTRPSRDPGRWAWGVSWWFAGVHRFL